MKKIILLLPLAILMVACGPSQEEYKALQQKNAQLVWRIDSLSIELEAYKYSPSKMLADAKMAAEKGDKAKINGILDKMAKYHPEAEEYRKIQNLLDNVIAKEKAKAEAERIKKEKEKQERLKAVKRLKKKHDDVQGITWYYNPYFTHYNDQNLVSLYMGETPSNVWLRLKMSYMGGDWIFFENAYLSYDGITREFPFNRYNDKKSDNYGGDVWEWIDLSVSNDDLAFMKNMVKGKSVKMQLSGKYTKTRTVSANEIKAIREMILAYEALRAEK